MTKTYLARLERLRRESILRRWRLTERELTEIIDANPSLRGMLLGYVSEHKVRREWFERDQFTDLQKYDDHDRSRKGDWSVKYRGV